MVHIPRWRIFAILAVALLGFAYAAPNALPGMRDLPDALPHKTVNLGLDLRGGAYLLYEVDIDALLAERRAMLEAGETLSDAQITEITDSAMARSIEIVRRRVDELGTTEPAIQRQGERRILLQVPGQSAESLKGIVGKTAKLGFHLVEQRPGPTSLRLPYADGPQGSEAMLPVARRAMVTGDMLVEAYPAKDARTGEDVVSFSLNGAGSQRFCQVTRANVGKPFAIVLDSEVISAPTIQQALCSGGAQISGGGATGFTFKEASDLALLLRAGALPAPMTVVEERTVGPSLGADSVRAGGLASVIGLAAVIAFMPLVYGALGLMAGAALLANVALIFAALSLLQATLTLPGIAGIVLTIGMAVDANVLVFERIAEERRAGRSWLSAVDTGYSQAMSTIVDANVTTLIAAIILFSFGTGPVKGFAVTLAIGIATSLFAAVMLTRIMVVAWAWRRSPGARVAGG